MIAPTIRRRVALTGIGAVTPIGTGRREFWEGVRTGRRGVGPLTRFDASAMRTRIAGEIPGRVMCQVLRQALAPSISAASERWMGTPCSAAR